MKLKLKEIYPKIYIVNFVIFQRISFWLTRNMCDHLVTLHECQDKWKSNRKSVYTAAYAFYLFPWKVICNPTSHRILLQFLEKGNFLRIKSLDWPLAKGIWELELMSKKIRLPQHVRTVRMIMAEMRITISWKSKKVLILSVVLQDRDAGKKNLWNINECFCIRKLVMHGRHVNGISCENGRHGW